ncbi:nucleotide exchange factor GrpE [Bifidobacterium sp.]|jgi:molecular chaperone GrpE|uniref:nucleotide exchange factor GrpE n=1 Tax=Bifidobacterium sp. TaxID=41200 RepID=UPI0025B8CE9A|nr:nucleotide exchange factor GrpE [Bifidobacterium sp.]MCH4210018.1 nucleotide exchange factor GrpE [Bifidobacterium sp.]MCI1225418.1 nucleotide exchange factor GrpE [Bifidobacterium sp.]
MSEFNRDDYLNDLPDADQAADNAAGSATDPAAKGDGQAPSATSNEQTGQAHNTADSDAEGQQAGSGAGGDDAGAGSDADGGGNNADTADNGQTAEGDQPSDAKDNADAKGSDSQDSLTPLGKAKQEAAEYLDALQRERAEFVNFRNRSKKEQDRFREHGIIDVLTALLPALDDIDRIKAHSDIDDSFNAVATKIDKAFGRFGVEKFGEAGEPFDPTKHEAILHKPDENVTAETVDTVVEAGYRIGDRVIRAARVVVASPKN